MDASQPSNKKQIYAEKDTAKAKQVVTKVGGCESCRYVAAATLSFSGLYIAYGIYKPPFDISRVGKRIIFTTASAIVSATAFVLAGAVLTNKLEKLTQGSVDFVHRMNEKLTNFDERYQQYKYNWSESLYKGKLERLKKAGKLPPEFENDSQK